MSELKTAFPNGTEVPLLLKSELDWLKKNFSSSVNLASDSKKEVKEPEFEEVWGVEVLGQAEAGLVSVVSGSGADGFDVEGFGVVDINGAVGVAEGCWAIFGNKFLDLIRRNLANGAGVVSEVTEVVENSADELEDEPSDSNSISGFLWNWTF